MVLLSDLNIVVLASDGVYHADVVSPREKLEKAGVSVFIASHSPIEVKAWQHDDWGIRLKVDKPMRTIRVKDFDGIIIPGGPLNTDTLRDDENAIKLIQEFFGAGKVIAAIGHGLQLLISAGILEGRQVASPYSIKTDVIAAGAIVEDSDVVSDNGLITCRCEQRLDKLNEIILEELRQGVHQRTETII